MTREIYQPVQHADLPCGISVIQKLSKNCPSTENRRATWYRIGILALTYIAYTCYHLSRKPISVVKNVLHQNCSEIAPPSGIQTGIVGEETSCSWAPFDGKNYTTLLGTLDSAFLFAYAAGMFISGMVAERVSLRYFLAFGMILSGIFSYLFGIARNYNIHELWYFIVVQVLGGFVQTTGWPGVVTVVGNWFGEGNRGLIFGIWNSHTSVGNILGSLIAGEFVETDWGLSFIVPGVVIAIAGFIVFLFLVPHPSIVGIAPHTTAQDQVWERSGYRRLDTSPPIDECTESGDELDDPVSYHQEMVPDEKTPITNVNNEKAIDFWTALKIPGVIEFSLSLFFAKLVSYTFLYWLPQYIKQSTSYSATVSAELSTLFDVGGIIGGIAAGLIRDFLGMSASTCAGMLTLAVPMLLIYDEYAHVSKGLNIFLLIIVGILVNGPYSLITTAVSAELGTSKTLQDNSKALATVTAIIDGTGSIGAAVGPLLAGVVTNMGWEYVFYMLMVADVAALLCLFRLVSREVRKFRDVPVNGTTSISS